MRLRKLEQRDATRMLAWMHDESVVNKLHTDFSKKTLEDCRAFIANCNDKENLHFAITNDDDEYMGTVSLKHITAKDAEFAITVCRDAMGKGYAIWAMQEIMKKGFNECGLKRIYWCVDYHNERAIRFYEKHKYMRFDVVKDKDLLSRLYAGRYSEEDVLRYVWYFVNDKEFRK